MTAGRGRKRGLDVKRQWKKISPSCAHCGPFLITRNWTGKLDWDVRWGDTDELIIQSDYLVEIREFLKKEWRTLFTSRGLTKPSGDRMKPMTDAEELAALRERLRLVEASRDRLMFLCDDLNKSIAECEKREKRAESFFHSAQADLKSFIEKHHARGKVIGALIDALDRVAESEGRNITSEAWFQVWDAHDEYCAKYRKNRFTPRATRTFEQAWNDRVK